MNPAVIAALIQGAGSIGGGLLGNLGKRETKQQKTSRQTADELLASLKGEGQFSNLFNTSDEAFQRSIVDPSMERFRNQIAPGIKEQFVGSGQQRGSSLDDSLTRAGVDLQSNIDQQFLPFQQGNQNRMTSALESILGMGSGAPQRLSFGESLGQSVGGYTSGDAFSSSIDKILKSYEDNQGIQGSKLERPLTTPKGFAPDYGTPRGGY